MKSFFVLIFLTIFSIANAQTIMTVEDALNIALKNNYGILVAHNDAAVSKANNTLGNAGMMPNVSLTGSSNFAPNNAKSYKTLSTGVELSWTLFDGGKMFVTKNKLSEIQSLGEIQFKEKVLQTQYSVVSAYFDVVRQKQQLNSINEIIVYNKTLVKILQTSFDGGSARKSSLLQAKIDLNVYTENAINQQFTIDAAKKYLNELLAISPDSSFEVSDSIPINFSFSKDELLQKLSSTNTSILSFQKQTEIAKLGLKEFSRSRFPQINFRAGYYMSQIDNSSSNYGPQFGGSISIPLYQSGKIRRQVSIAKLDVQSAEYDLENIKLQVKNDLLNAITQFENQQHLQAIEKENNALTKENLEISMQRMKLGETTTLEVHQAQENYVQSCTRLINFEYNLKIAETKLKQLLASM
jgi:outer membrane protein TolC